MARITQTQSDSKLGRFWASFKDAFSVVAVLVSFMFSIGMALYAWGGSQTSSAAEIQKLKDGQAAINNTIIVKSETRDKQFDEIKRTISDKADKNDIENVNKQLQLLREESKETRDLLFRVLESRNK